MPFIFPDKYLIIHSKIGKRKTRQALNMCLSDDEGEEILDIEDYPYFGLIHNDIAYEAIKLPVYAEEENVFYPIETNVPLREEIKNCNCTVKRTR